MYIYIYILFLLYIHVKNIYINNSFSYIFFRDHVSDVVSGERVSGRSIRKRSGFSAYISPSSLSHPGRRSERVTNTAPPSPVVLYAVSSFRAQVSSIGGIFGHRRPQIEAPDSTPITAKSTPDQLEFHITISRPLCKIPR